MSSPVSDCFFSLIPENGEKSKSEVSCTDLRAYGFLVQEVAFDLLAFLSPPHRPRNILGPHPGAHLLDHILDI